MSRERRTTSTTTVLSILSETTLPRRRRRKECVLCSPGEGAAAAWLGASGFLGCSAMATSLPLQSTWTWASASWPRLCRPDPLSASSWWKASPRLWPACSPERRLPSDSARRSSPGLRRARLRFLRRPLLGRFVDDGDPSGALGQDEFDARQIALGLANETGVVETIGEVLELALEAFVGEGTLELGEILGGAVAQVAGFHFRTPPARGRAWRPGACGSRAGTP